MSSSGFGPPLPPSGKSDKGKGKKSYVVKLITPFNNEIGSSSQPTTPTSTSTGTSVPSSLQVPGFNPTPHTSTPTSLPSPLQGPVLTPTPYQVPTNQMASLSPNVGSNLSTPTNIAPSPGIVDADPHSSSPNNDEEECSNGRPMITPVGGGFYPTRTASKAITATIKQQFDEPWLTWGQIPKETRDVFFDRFKDTWNGLLEKWNMPLYRQKCETAKKNRTSEKGGCLHIGGSISVHEHAIRLSQELGRFVHVDEIFQQTHIRQSTGEFVDESPLDPAEEERLRNRCWLEAIGGKYKGRVYDIGNVSSQDDCVDSYIQQTQASSSTQQQNSEEIVNLKSQLQQYGQQLEKFQGFISVLLSFLPPSAATAAQDF
ncbi:hypothetical protein LR48_Vigan10g122000 [Vigna angularis]|uniref:Uncharacterized protein n=1 Tax=Phaseolus angularis TaxID=3914 RepID=A0A0L9VK10_PHAAN|nr:hypothetical protein LR48_Vigan10g122000 [Vigna angularis]